MQVGTKLIAPQGFSSLEAGLSYYFLRSVSAVQIVHLLLFSRNKSSPLVHLCSIPRDEFEIALSKNLVSKDQDQMPPAFIAPAYGQDLAVIDLNNTNRAKKQSDQDRAQARLWKIAPLLKRQDEILSAEDPTRVINKYATQNKLNAQRTRLWFFSYLCFGQSEWVLAPRYFNCGQWDRLGHPGTSKFGRKSIVSGAHAGTRLTTDVIERIINSYKRRRADGRTMTSIYQQAMVKDFKALVITDEHNKKRLVSRNGSPIPTLDQYRYQVKKAVGQQEVQQFRWGKERQRRRNAQHRGAFSSSVSNLFERVESDGYYTEDRPMSYADSQPLPPLNIVRIVDTASGMRLGIGFAFGAENSEAYNTAMFCSAISKKKFCDLFDIKIEEHQWPAQGIPPHSITDRGPGVKREPGSQQNQASETVIRELTPSHQGQSKSLVESAQRRVTQTEGAPQHLLSELSPYQMAVREIHRLILENQSSDASSRLTPEMIRDEVMPNPLGVFNFLNSRARNDGVSISFDEAVRKYLKKVEVTTNRQGVMLLGQRFNSDALRQTGILNRSGHSATRRLTAYILPLCVRYLWLELGHQLIEVKAELNLRDDESQLYRSHAELQVEDALLKQRQAEQRVLVQAVATENIGKFEEMSGGNWHSKRSTSRLPSAQSQRRRPDVAATAALLAGKDHV